MNVKKSLMGCLLAGLSLAAPGAQTLALPVANPGLQTATFPAVADTHLRQAAPNSPQGGDRLLRVKSADRARTLVRFDQTALAAALTGATLRSARLELYVQAVEGHRGSDRTVGTHRLNATWTESGATWMCPADTRPANPRPDCPQRWDGGTFEPVPTSTLLHASTTKGWMSFDVTSDVAAFLTGTPNHGWLLKIADEQQRGRVEYSAREAGPALAPRLVVTFESRDTIPPSITGLTPADNSFLSQAAPAVGADFSDRQSGIDPSSVRFLLDNEDRTADAQVSTAGIRFLPPQPLAEGLHSAFVSVRDLAGQYASASWLFAIDTRPPGLAIETPSPGQLFNRSTARVAGEADDDSGIVSLLVNGMPVAVAEGSFETELALNEGDNLIRVQATDLAGNGAEASVLATRFSLPSISITAPEDLSFIAATTIQVTGIVDDPAATVEVNGIPATVSGTTFSATGVPLIEGGNILTATATNVQGHVGTASVSLVRDLTPPRLAVTYPRDGSRTSEPTVTVTGLVNDIVAGTVNASEATVTVNGRPAEVANRSFKAEGIPLAEGDNTLIVIAVDAGGNRAEILATVRRQAPGRRLTILSGNGQTGFIDQPLPQPLRVALLDATGSPVAGKPVLFKVVGNNGHFAGGKRRIAVPTDAQGQAEAQFHLGTRAGVGNQAVEALVAGFEEAIFTADALPTEPALIVVDSGDQQVGIASHPLPRPLVAVVTDAGYNRLEGVPVKLSIVMGGHFENGLNEITTVTDSDGRAIVSWTLGPEEGIARNVAKAVIASLPGSPAASFTATGRAAGHPVLTAISGVVLDNSNLPVPGVTLRIRDTSLTAETDDQGLFRISPAPVGTVHLIVDGSTARRPGSWPDLEFLLTTIPGRDNTVGMPIYLLPLNLEEGLLVDETRGGTLTLPDFPGFALEVAPGSVTFPGGGKSGVISVTRVNSDKVPMVPNFGQQPRFIVTIQPAGARFDPPARLTLPNLEGLESGRVTELYSFDHDLAHFVSIGPATVSEDGTTIVSNPGVGILKAGWHCGGDPASSGTLEDCPECTKCVDGRCSPEQLCTACTPAGNACDGVGSCRTGRELIPKICEQLKLETTNHRHFQCVDVPSVGGPDTCGGVLVVLYTKVTHSCDSVDLKGARITEHLKTDHGCSPPDFDPDQGGEFFVKTGNDISGNGDFYSLCAPVEALPLGRCVETFTQQQNIDGCIRTVKITFEFNKTSTGCSGTVTRQ